MHKKILFSIVILIAILTSLVQIHVQAQSATDPIHLLPSSDIVVVCDLQRLLNDALPRLLAKSPQSLSKLNAELDDLKTKTSFDVRSVNRIVLGASGINPNTSYDKWNGIAIAQGSFNANTLIAFGRLALNGKYEEQTYQGKTVYRFPINIDEKMKQANPSSPSTIELAMVALNDNTFAIGRPDTLRTTIDISMGEAKGNTDMIELTNKDPNALISISANVESIVSSMPNLTMGRAKELKIDPMDKLGSPQGESRMFGDFEGEFKKILESIKHMQLSTGMTSSLFNMALVARTKTVDQANVLHGMIDSLKQIASNNNDPKMAKMLERIKLSIQGNDVKITAEMPQEELALLVQESLKTPTPIKATPKRRGAATQRRRRR
jgi:hypothetical protein